MLYIMRKVLILAVLNAISLVSLGAQEAQSLRKESDGSYVVNTSYIGRLVEGYNGATPLEVYIKGNKILRVVALPNNETPKFFRKVEKELLPQLEGLDIKKATKQLEVDATSGATLSSNAVIEHLRLALKHYNKKK